MGEAMQNQFDQSNYSEGVPTELVAGSRWAWNASEITSVYSPAEYSLKYKLSLQEAPFSDFSVDADGSGGAFVVEMPAADTAGHPAGEYAWQAMITRTSDSEVVTVDGGFTSILPNLNANPGDTRSWVAQTLAAIRATLLGTASKEQASYEIGGRSIALRTPAELLALEKEFAARWEQEQKAADLAAGRVVRNRVLVGMSA